MGFATSVLRGRLRVLGTCSNVLSGLLPNGESSGRSRRVGRDGVASASLIGSVGVPIQRFPSGLAWPETIASRRGVPSHTARAVEAAESVLGPSATAIPSVSDEDRPADTGDRQARRFRDGYQVVHFKLWRSEEAVHVTPSFQTLLSPIAPVELMNQTPAVSLNCGNTAIQGVLL